MNIQSILIYFIISNFYTEVYGFDRRKLKKETK